MAKDKKNKNGKKKGKAEGSVLATFKTLGNNKLVADVVAAALVATAAALKDPDKARRFASEAGDQLEKMSKDGAERGGAMWKLALDVGRRALDTMSGDKPAKAKRAGPKAAAKRKTKTAAKPKAKAAAKPKAKTTAKTKAKAATRSKAKTAARPKSKTAAKPKAKTAAKPKAKNAAKPKAAAKPRPKAAARSTGRRPAKKA